MRHLHRHLLIIAGLAIGISAANASGLGPGSPAPALDVKTWYKGKPVKSFQKNKVYVVEFWATWCGPCKTSIPHLTELAKKNKDVTFIGISIWEDDNGTNIKKFVEEMGNKMDYTVGYSGNKTGMSVTWMNAAGQNGIPSSFIVKNGEIQWVGHPMEMDEPLAQVKAGKFDLAAFKVKFDKQAEESRQQMAARAEMSVAQKLISEGKTAEAKAKIAQIEQQYPAVKDALEGLKFGLLAKEDPTAWEQSAKDLAATKKPESIGKLWMYAMDQTRPGGDLATGTKAMDLALEAAEDKDFVVLYYGTTFFKQAKDYKKALALAEKSLALLPNTQYKDSKELKAELEKTKSEMAAKANNG
jgi:thiol-disulfide isomerase/thioredoxin